MQSQLLTCAAGCQRVVLDAALSPVQSRLLTCAAGCQRVVLDAALHPVQSRLLTCAAGCQRVVLDAALSPVQSRLLTCVVDAPVSDRSSYSSRSWGGVYVIAGFTECSRRKLLARADDVRYNIYIYIIIYIYIYVVLRGWIKSAARYYISDIYALRRYYINFL